VKCLIERETVEARCDGTTVRVFSSDEILRFGPIEDFGFRRRSVVTEPGRTHRTKSERGRRRTSSSRREGRLRSVALKARGREGADC